MVKSKEVYTINETGEVKAPLVCSVRLTLAILAFLGFFLCYAQRNGLAIAIVCMVNPDTDKVGALTRSNDSSTNYENIPVACRQHSAEQIRSPGQILPWPAETRGVMLGSFYWGYALTQIPSSILVNILGPKRFLALLILVSSLSTMLLPVFSRVHVSIVILLRVLTGAAQGGLWPTIFRFWASWAPKAELTTLLSFQSAGPSMGTILSLIVGGLFCTFSLNEAIPFIFRFGWAYFFYLLGGLGVIWSIVWYIFASDAPSTNTHISDNEKEYIRACKAAEKIQDSNVKIPWGSIFRSQGFWCTLLSMFFCDFGLYAIWAVVPQYMSDKLLFRIKGNGFLSALPHIASFIVVMSTGGLADLIIQKGYLKRVNTRKLFHGIGTLSPAICLLLMSFLDCERRYLAVLLLVIGVALNGFMMSGGYVVNVGDYTGIHSGVVFGICNTISCLGGFGAPYITSLITKHFKNHGWRIAFTMYAASFLLSAIIFSLFARGEPEAWAKDDAHDEKINYDAGADKELLEMNTTVVPPTNPVV